MRDGIGIKDSVIMGNVTANLGSSVVECPKCKKIGQFALSLCESCGERYCSECKDWDRHRKECSPCSRDHRNTINSYVDAVLNNVTNSEFRELVGQNYTLCLLYADNKLIPPQRATSEWHYSRYYKDYPIYILLRKLKEIFGNMAIDEIEQVLSYDSTWEAKMACIGLPKVQRNLKLEQGRLELLKIEQQKIDSIARSHRRFEIAMYAITIILTGFFVVITTSFGNWFSGMSLIQQSGYVVFLAVFSFFATAYTLDALFNK